MQLTLTSGVFVLTVDATSPASPSRLSAASANSPEGASEWLELLDSYGVEAAWCVAPHASDAFVRSLVHRRQEIAIDLESLWRRDAAPLAQAERALVSELTRLTDLGVSALSVACHQSPSSRTLALLASHGVRAVTLRPRPAHAEKSSARAAKTTSPRPLAHGCWELPASAALPMRAGWFSSSLRRITRGIDAEAEIRGCYQLAVSLTQRSGAAPPRRLLARVLKHVALRRQLGVIETMGASGLVAMATGLQQRQPLRSILRPAA